ncbi:MAG TPA: hypothetical protein VD813_14785 [Pseudonocardia sp.]|nr:hypothetical protein [Pseudonocardia sp.]
MSGSTGDLRGFRLRWTVAFVLGELVGFVPPAVTGAALAALGAPDALLVAGLVVAGAVEGAVLGAAQAHVMGPVLPAVAPRRWVVATAAGAAIAWLAGMGGSALLAAVGPAAWVVAGPGYVVGLFAMGVLQWRELRHAVPHAGRWVPVTAVAWLLGVAIPVVALSTIPNSGPIAADVAVGVVAAVAMGAVVGGLTGGTLARLIAAREAPAAARPSTPSADPASGPGSA